MVRLSNLLYLDRRMEVDWYLKSKQRNVNTRIKETQLERGIASRNNNKQGLILGMIISLEMKHTTYKYII